LLAINSICLRLNIFTLRHKNSVYIYSSKNVKSSGSNFSTPRERQIFLRYIFFTLKDGLPVGRVEPTFGTTKKTIFKIVYNTLENHLPFHFTQRLLCGGFSALNGPAKHTDYPGTLVIILLAYVVKIKRTIENSEKDSGDKFRQKRSWKFDNKELTFGHEGHL